MTEKLAILLGVVLLAAPVMAASPGVAGGRRPEPPLERFGEAISVGLATVRVRVLDPAGAPILGLTPAAVRVRIGRRAVPVVAVDYYDGAVSAADAPDDLVRLPPAEAGRHSPHQVSARGQMFVFVVEAGAQGENAQGGDAALDTTPSLKRLVEGLRPEALAAVVSLDPRLKLQLDLTRDREAIYQAIVRGRQGGEGRERPPAPDPLSLSRNWPGEAAAQASRMDRALSLLAADLAPLPGEKVLIFLGQKSGPLSLPASWMGQPETPRTIRNLQEARATLFVLDEPRSLSTPTAAHLHILASSTGGTYAQAGRLTREVAIDRLARQMRGYYLVTFNLEQLQGTAREEPLTVALSGRRGTVLASPFRVVILDS